MSGLKDIAGALGVTDPDTEKDRLQKISDFVQGDVQKVRLLEQQLGRTDLGEKRLDRVYRHVKLQDLVNTP